MRATFVSGGMIGDQLAGVGIALAHDRYRRGHSDLALFQRRFGGQVVEFLTAQNLFRRVYEIPTGGHGWREWMLEWPWNSGLMGHLQWATNSAAADIFSATMSWHPDGPAVKHWGPGVVPAHIVARLIKRFSWAADPFILLHPWSVAGSCSANDHWRHMDAAVADVVSMSPIPTVVTGLGSRDVPGCTHNLMSQLSYMELAALVALSHAVVTTSNSVAFLAAIFDRPALVFGNTGWRTSVLKRFFIGSRSLHIFPHDDISIARSFMRAILFQ